ncbi:WD40 repeat-like protein [Amniculicola lignicola CBS 123094]|uniref:WD40 repeat-like protein n=1 Tax=Amniculicola lignicola CBS 123094 TaxID=1392246 RepID=A0A6A5X389_9PLEO|nr:WD40 repeat-like protein [Amniculicola lignicola CBS 123094]
MKASPLLVSWHNENAPVYSAHFEPHGKGRLATAGGDNNVRLWKIDANGEERKVTYLSTLVKHTQAVNVVRWCPRGETLASAGDDGNILLWVPAENHSLRTNFEEGFEDKETWRVKHMCRSMGSEIYDLAWSPDGVFFITGSMDNIARIYNAQTGTVVRQIAEHNHYVQGVAWDPLNEFVATQSSDRSVHIYTLKTKDGQFSLAQHSKVTKMDLPARRISSNSPAPPDFGGRASFVGHESMGSPIPSAPGTPQSLALPMNPPPTSHSRRSSFGSSPSIRRSASPAPSMPLPAVMPNSPSIGSLGGPGGLGVRGALLYANETFTSFFRRLTFAPDGSLLFTPAGQYKTLHPSLIDATKNTEDIINTVYIYTRAGLNKPPVAYLPGHKKPSVAVRCSPVYYTLRQAIPPTKQITIDTSSADDEIPALPEPALPSKAPTSHSSMDPPPLTSAPSPSPSVAAASPKPVEFDTPSSGNVPSGPTSAFSLPYRMVYAVATQDAVHIYDTQQQKPLCVVSNLHFATFTDLTWASDGLTLLITSSDGFCSSLTFSPGELGEKYTGPLATSKNHAPSSINTTASQTSNHSTPTPTPTTSNMPVSATATAGPKQPPAGFPASPSSFIPARPGSPTRSNSVSSIATASSFAQGITDQSNFNAPTPTMASMPGLAAANTGPVGGMPMWTPPLTPAHGHGGTHSASSSVSGIPGVGTTRRESESEDGGSTNGTRKRELQAVPEVEEGREGKRRRIAPTPVTIGSADDSAIASTEENTPTTQTPTQQ